MNSFVSYEKGKSKAKIIIDTRIYNKNIVMKSAYALLDKAYFLFKLDNEDIIVEIFTKENNNVEGIVADFLDELLNVYLRDLLEKQNKIIREDIVTRAIGSSLDEKNFVSIDPNRRAENCQVDFDKDIDEILKEIENDPELQIDKEEIEKILKEIEEETETMEKK